MKNLFSSVITASFMAVMALPSSGQGIKLPAPSPKQVVEQEFALSTINIEYSRPGAKGRKVFGDVVPFGKVWRTGANASTKITFGSDVKVEGQDLKAGTYALYTIPNVDSWDIMFYKDLTLGGNVSKYKAEDEALKIKAKPSPIKDKIETFLINVDNFTSTTAAINLMWENTKVSFKVETSIDEQIMKDIEKNVIQDNRPYYAAARYYYENGKDLKMALDWINKAVEARPKAYWVSHLKAEIQLGLKDYKGAIATAEISKAAAKEDEDDAYVKKNDKLIEEAQKGANQSTK